MPELPEVETIRQQLEKEIKGTTIKEVIVNFVGRLNQVVASTAVRCGRGSCLINMPVKKFIKAIQGKKITAVNRRAKLLSLQLSGGWNIFVHLKMTGRLLVVGGRERGLKGGKGRESLLKSNKHTHVVFELSNGRELRWEDVRKFGYLKLLNEKDSQKFIENQNYGPEPLDKNFTWQRMAMCLRSKSKAKIKPHLLDQTCIAGIGNIYATEALWMAKISPQIPVGKINDEKMKILHRSLVAILKKSILCGGTSSDDYVDAYGQQGTFAKKLKVYSREGKACSRCQTKLIKIKVGGRGTVFCQKCQKLANN